MPSSVEFSPEPITEIGVCGRSLEVEPCELLIGIINGESRNATGIQPSGGDATVLPNGNGRRRHKLGECLEEACATIASIQHTVLLGIRIIIKPAVTTEMPGRKLQWSLLTANPMEHDVRGAKQRDH